MSESVQAMTSVTRVRLGGPGGLAPLRRRVRAMLRDCPPGVVVDVVLLADGLAGAACEHGVPPFEVLLSRTGGVLRVEVAPVPEQLDLGFGATVLNAVSTRWAIEPGGVLWAERELGAFSRS